MRLYITKEIYVCNATTMDVFQVFQITKTVKIFADGMTKVIVRETRCVFKPLIQTHIPHINFERYREKEKES